MQNGEKKPGSVESQKAPQEELNTVLEKTRKQVAKMEEELRKEGHVFELKEVDNDFVLLLGDREIHFLKADPFPVEKSGKEPLKPPPSIDEVIRAAIIDPDASRYDTIVSLRGKKKGASGR